MLDAWRNRTRDWLATAEKLLALPEQQSALSVLNHVLQRPMASPALVYLWGASGAGKRSLIKYAFRQQARARRGGFCSATADEWCQELHSQDETGSITSWADVADVVVCENLQTIPDPRRDGDRLARWLDHVLESGSVVILTSDRLPSQIDDLSPRLASRLRAGLLTGIRPLEEESLRRLSRFWLPDQTSHARASLVPSTLLTAGQLKEFLTQSGNADVPIKNAAAEYSLDSIAEAVARDFQISLTELCSGSRAQQLKVPRSVAMSLARELTPCSLLAIGQYFGCRSHSSVVRSCSRLQELLPEAPSLREQIQLLRVKLRHNLSAECG